MEKFIGEKDKKDKKSEEKLPWIKDIPLILLLVIFFGYFNFFTEKSYNIMTSLYYLFIFLIIARIVYPPIFELITKGLSYLINPPKIELKDIINKVNRE